MKILIINQSFYPDESATAQYAWDLAQDLKTAGHTVQVLTSRRGYLTPHSTYPAEELLSGIQVRRVCSPALPRRFKMARIVDALLLNLALTFRALRLGAFDCTVCLTSPPLLGMFIALLPKRVRGALIHWSMDINPDQALRAGWITAGGIVARMLEKGQLFFYRACDQIVVLDQYMRDLLLSKGIAKQTITVVPLWWNDHELLPDKNTVQRMHTEFFPDKTVIMYAGNHSMCHPLDAMLQAALLLRNEPRYLFVFSGGGSRVQEVLRFKEAHALTNIMQMPYRRREELYAFLSCAAVHFVSMGADYIGVVHPSKVYPLIALDKPFIAAGPTNSSVGDMVREGARGVLIETADGPGFIAALREFERTAVSNDTRLKQRYARSAVFAALHAVLKQLVEPPSRGAESAISADTQ